METRRNTVAAAQGRQRPARLQRQRRQLGWPLQRLAPPEGHDSNGLHSWIETNGWSIDAGNGAKISSGWGVNLRVDGIHENSHPT
jgi:uncharacterized protein YjcR